VASLAANPAGQEVWPGVAILETLAAATEAAEDRLVKEYSEDLLIGAERAHDFSWALGRAADTMRKKPRLILEEIVSVANERTSTRVTSPTDGFALASVVASIIVTLTQGGESFEAAVTRAVALGGDTDTVGAIVGALCGVFHGIEGVPERWQDGLSNSEGLVRYADGLVEPLQRDLPEPIDAESRLCSEEEARRQAVAAKIR
jgi:ADP-ribosylglycohydrolase